MVVAARNKERWAGLAINRIQLPAALFVLIRSSTTEAKGGTPT